MKHWPAKKEPPRWSVQEAKARFSELLDASIEEGPQMITKRGAETAVLVPVEEWNRLVSGARPTLKDLLLADEPRFDLDIPKRGTLRHRQPFSFDD